MLRKLLELREMNTGVHPALHDDVAPIWKNGRNVIWTESGAKKMAGWTAINAGGSGTTNPIRGIAQQLVNAGQQLFYGDASAIYHWDTTMSAGANVSISGGYSGVIDETVTQDATVWSMEVWGTYIVATNGVDAVQNYQTGVSSNFSDLEVSGQFSTAEILIKRGPHLLALNTSTGGDFVHWCDQDDITTWSANASNAAGSLQIRDLESDIKAAVALGDRIAVYGKASMHILSYLGSPNYFGWNPGLTGIGAVGKQAVVALDRVNYGLCQQGFFRTDGVQFDWIDESIREWFMDRINWSQASKVTAYHDEEKRQVIWYYPTTTDEPDEGVGFDYQRGVWTIYDHGRSAAVERQVFAYPVIATPGGAVYYQNFGQDADGSAIASYLETKAFDGGRPEYKELTEARALISDFTGSLSLSVAVLQNLDDSVTYGTVKALDDGTEKVEMRNRGRYAKFRFRSDSVGDEWHVSGLDVYGRVSGNR